MLPVPLTPLVGRDREVQALTRQLRDPVVRLVTLTGPGGVGKTRLAIAALAAVVDDPSGDSALAPTVGKGQAFSDEVTFVPLAAIRDPALVLPTIAAELGLRERGDRSPLAQLTDWLRSRRVLLALDNLEQVATAAPSLSELLSSCPGLTILATSRVSLHVSGERVFPVGPLGLVEADVPSLAELADVPAIALFVERARAVEPTFALDEANAGAIGEICHRLDGLPLAIELAAARTRVLTPEALLARLTDRFRLLTGGALDQPPRLRSLRDAVGWSYDLLTPEEQTLFRRLAVFAGGCTLDAIEAVCGDGEDALDAVEALVDHSLMQREPGLPSATAQEPIRFGMLETIRAFAFERLTESGELPVLRRRHADYFLELAEEAARAFSTGAELMWIRRLNFEVPNLRAALTWAAEQEGAECLVNLAQALWWFWELGTISAEGYAWRERAAARSADLPAAHHGKRSLLLTSAAREATWQGRFARASALLDESLSLAREVEDAGATLRAIHGRGLCALVQGELDQAEQHLTVALDGWRKRDEPAWIVDALYLLGYAAALRAEHGRAEMLFAEGLAVARALGSNLQSAFGLEALGTCAREQGDIGRAAPLFAEALTMLRHGYDSGAIANCLKSLGAVAAAIGQADQAARLFGAMAALQERRGISPMPLEQARLDRAIAPARTRLSEPSFAAAWAAGRALPLDQAVAEALAVAEAVAAAPGSRPDPVGLSPRELQVLGLVAAGQTDQQIAAALFVSRRTVNSHVASILAKLGVSSRREAAAFATDHGII